MNNHFDFIGIGIGPFNLSLAALTHGKTGLHGIFFDSNSEFDWHPGMMLDNTTLQVPFLADLVTMADPCNPFSFLSYLKKNNRIYKFYIKEDFFILRKEYNMYCKWVCRQLPECVFGHTVEAVTYDTKENIYTVIVRENKSDKEIIYHTPRVVIGTGTAPFIPAFVRDQKPENTFHTSEYLFRKNEILKQKSITIIGSGQSAAEIFHDLLNNISLEEQELNWYTRPDRLFPLEYSKLTLELTSPEYVDHFYSLPPDKRADVLNKQSMLYKGINYDLINEIYDMLYHLTLDGPIPVNIKPCHEFKAIATSVMNRKVLSFRHVQTDQKTELETDAVILATGYKYKVPDCIRPVHDRIKWDHSGRFDVNRNYSIDHSENEIFVQNAELHTHGFVTPDLGMGAYRNATIINVIAGTEIYTVEKQIAFQSFSASAMEVMNDSVI